MTGDEPTPPPAAREAECPPNHPYGVLRNKDFRRFMLAGMAATIGGQMQGVAVGWELYERTRSATALGMVGLAQFLPVILLALPAGHAADRHNRKYQLIVAHGLFALASVGLALLSAYRGPIGLAYVFLVLTGIGQAVSMPARWALLPQLVPREQVSRAVTWNTSSWQVASVAGPALGGFVIAITRGATWVYWLSVVCSAVVIGLFCRVHPRPSVRDFDPVSIRSLFAGLRFVMKTELILATITLDLFAVLFGGATALLPIYARDILHIGPTGLGWLRTAPSLGAFATALVLAHRPPLRRAGPALLWAVGGFGLATIVFGVSRDPVLSFVMLLLTGALDNISVVVRGTLVQVLTPDEMRGRVSAVNAIFIGSSNKLGEFESGLAARFLGTVPSVVLGGVGTLLVVLTVPFIWPSVRRLGVLHEPDRDVEQPSSA
ncbi:MAG: MFS transporter [Isosphaeraceae bacterium]|nr:MFS transporter [Isosphaeraceae bacterium]